MIIGFTLNEFIIYLSDLFLDICGMASAFVNSAISEMHGSGAVPDIATLMRTFWPTKTVADPTLKSVRQMVTDIQYHWESGLREIIDNSVDMYGGRYVNSIVETVITILLSYSTLENGSTGSEMFFDSNIFERRDIREIQYFHQLLNWWAADLTTTGLPVEIKILFALASLDAKILGLTQADHHLSESRPKKIEISSPEQWNTLPVLIQEQLIKVDTALAGPAPWLSRRGGNGRTYRNHHNNRKTFRKKH